MDDLAERLRQDNEMLCDGYQRNLTKLWHSVVVKDAAKDCEEAANEIERLQGVLHGAKICAERDDDIGLVALLHCLKEYETLSPKRDTETGDGE